MKSLSYDGKDYIKNLLPKYLGAVNTALNAWIMEHILVGMVKRVFNPGCKFDDLMVLTDVQGVGKTSFIEKLALLPEWYCSLNNIKDKDAVSNLVEIIKDRIVNKDRELGNIIDIKNNDKVITRKGYKLWATKHNLQTAASTLVKIRNKGFKSMEELERGISRLSIEKNELKQEFDRLLWEQKRIKEVVKHIQICISKREYYDGYRKNPNDKIYMMMNRKDVEAYQKYYEEIDVFLKQFPHLRHTVVGELKTKSSKNPFRKLNEHSKELQAKQEEVIKKHNSLVAEREELEHLKDNMNSYIGRTKTEEKKESVIGAVKRHKAEERRNPKGKIRISKEAER